MILLIDACLGNNSRTRKLANSYASAMEGETTQCNLYKKNIPLLDENTRNTRRNAGILKDAQNLFVSLATEFANADKIIIAAPFHHFSYPAVLSTYLEAIMIEGITFDTIEPDKFSGKCNASELILVTAAGGSITKPNYQYEHIKSLVTKVFGINKVSYYYLDRLDYPDVDGDALINEKINELKSYSNSGHNFGRTIRNIMVVDDSKINIIKTEHILKEAGYETTPASNGSECLRLLKLSKIDMILLDIEMPDMDGFETLEEIRKLPGYDDVPIVFVTSDNTMDVVIKASQHKVSGFVTKPFTKDELMVHINKAKFE